MKRRTIHLGLTALVTMSLAARAGVRESWVNRFDKTDNDAAWALAVDDAGNVYVTGEINSYTIWTLKYEASGREVWRAPFQGNGDVAGVAIGVDRVGNTYVAGRSYRDGRYYDIVVFSFDAQGLFRWVQYYAAAPFSWWDEATALAVDSQGNVIVAGYGTRVDSGRDYVTLKYDSQGNLLWERLYDGPARTEDQALALALAPNDDVIVTGKSKGANSDYDYATVRYSPEGDLRWVRRYNGPVDGPDLATAVTADAAGNTYVTGTVNFGGDGGDDYVTIKYGPGGSLEWARRYDGPAHGQDDACGIGVDRGGNVLVTGSSDGVSTGPDYCTLKYGPQGELVWEKRVDGARMQDYARALVLDGQDNAYVTGSSEAGVVNNYDYFTLAYTPTGRLLWKKRYNGPHDWMDNANALACDSHGNVYVAGSSLAQSVDYATVRYETTPQVQPEQFAVTWGEHLGGSLGDLLESDDSYVVVQAVAHFSISRPWIEVVVEAISPWSQAQALRFTLEAAATFDVVEQWIDLYDFQADRWERVDVRKASRLDAVTTVSFGLSGQRFVHPASGLMKARIGFFDPIGVVAPRWSAQIDQTVWSVIGQ